MKTEFAKLHRQKRINNNGSSKDQVRDTFSSNDMIQSGKQLLLIERVSIINI